MDGYISHCASRRHDIPSDTKAEQDYRSFFPWSPGRSRSRHTSSPAHELPRWRTPSPMFASTIPPPIVQSTYISPRQAEAQSVVLEQKTPFSVRQDDIEADLQFLLDAQEEGLVEGYYGGQHDDWPSTTSTTLTVDPSVRSASTSRGLGQLRRKKLSLRSARKGIYTRMLALSEAKREELQDIEEHVREQDQTLEKIEQWSKKREGLQTASQSLGMKEEQAQLEQLQAQREKLQREMDQVVLRLTDMQTAHRKIERRIAEIKNVSDAKLATYATSLRMLDQEVQRFLSTPPESSKKMESIVPQKVSLWQLPPQRRTLELSREYFTDERELVLAQRQTVEQEIAALDEGAPVWKEVCTKVAEFERRLRADMSRLSPQTSRSETSPWEDPTLHQHPDRASGLRKLLEHMDALIETLESKLAFVQERRWNLLVAAIGAELDAMVQGKAMLEGLLQDCDSSTKGGFTDTTDTSGERADSGEQILDLDKSFHSAKLASSADEEHVTTAEDEPEPDLLFSKRQSDID